MELQRNCDLQKSNLFWSSQTRFRFFSSLTLLETKWGLWRPALVLTESERVSAYSHPELLWISWEQLPHRHRELSIWENQQTCETERPVSPSVLPWGRSSLLLSFAPQGVSQKARQEGCHYGRSGKLPKWRLRRGCWSGYPRHCSTSPLSWLTSSDVPDSSTHLMDLINLGKHWPASEKLNCAVDSSRQPGQCIFCAEGFWRSIPGTV